MDFGEQACVSAEVVSMLLSVGHMQVGELPEGTTWWMPVGGLTAILLATFATMTWKTLCSWCQRLCPVRCPLLRLLLT